MEQVLSINDYFRSLAKGGAFYYRPNTGNAGDSLIACATFQIFERMKLPYHPFKEESFDPEGKILVLGGGGSFVREYKETREFIERYHTSVKKLVLLPHTVSGHQDLFGKLGRNVDIITREKVSYDYAKKHAPNANVLLADDLALELDVRPLLSSKGGFFSLLANRDLSLKRTLRIHVFLVREAVKRGLSCKDPHVLNCFRTDKEQTEICRPSGNVDLSRIFKYGTATPTQAFYATHMVLRFINRYDEVRTNRLHMAVAGALLGKDVKFYPNSYFKCEAVYEFSLKNRFPNVHWMGA